MRLEVRWLAQDHTANKRLQGNLPLSPSSRFFKIDLMMPWICIVELTYPISWHLNFGIYPQLFLKMILGMAS